MSDETVVEESGSADCRTDVVQSKSQPGPTYINPNEDETYVPAEEDADAHDDSD